jgi:hypothetical protein
MRKLAPLLATLLLPACAPQPADEDLPLGDVSPDDFKADGNWGHALECKAIPSLPRLVNPRITVSLNGLTLHLTDDAGFDKVFPIGPGKVDGDDTSATFGESLSYAPLLGGRPDFTLQAAAIQPCKTWWTDPETGEKQPVFAGLPFMPWNGAYAIHGPIDNYRAANGGNLRRGFVSHGCIRMEAADVLEVYGRIRGVPSVPVHVQREPERDARGRRVDVAQRWIGAECAGDGDCNFPGGFCHANRWSLRGFCSARCTTTCADRPGQPTTFCVADPEAPSSGMCVAQVQPQNPDCRFADHFVATPATRFNRPSVHATACVPGSPGWIGDHCWSDDECRDGAGCAGAGGGRPGTCTEACTRFCPDEPGWPTTFCAAGSCQRRCTPASNASECAGGTACVTRTNAVDGRKASVCISQ